MNRDILSVEPIGQSGGRCDCCGQESRTVWGGVSAGDAMVACYFVNWTRERPDHYANLDFLLGTWGDETKNYRVLVSWVYSADHDQFMLVDSATRPAAESDLCSRTMTRDEVLADANLLQSAKNALDAVWLSDKRIEEVKAKNDA